MVLEIDNGAVLTGFDNMISSNTTALWRKLFIKYWKFNKGLASNNQPNKYKKFGLFGDIQSGIPLESTYQPIFITVLYA